MDDIITSKKKLSTKIRFLVNSFKEDIYTRHCYLCDATTSAKISLCEACFRDLPWKLDCCTRCGLEVDSQPYKRQHNPPLDYPQSSQKISYLKEANSFSTHADCIECRNQHYYFDRCITPFNYTFPIPEIIYQYKYLNKRFWKRPLGSLLTLYLLNVIDHHYADKLYPYPDVIVPVPISSSKLKQRQFNQTEELARFLCRRLDATLVTQATKRHDDTPSQVSLSLTERRANTKAAYSPGRLIKLVENKSVLIVDDVITTASTVDEIARILKNAGAKSVEVWGLARTPKRR